MAAWPVHGWECFEDGQHHSFAVPGLGQEHSDVFLAAAVGFGAGHHKVWIPTRPSIQREGGSLLAQPQHRLKKYLTGYPEGRTHPSCGGNCTHGSKRKQLLHRASGTVAGGMSSSRSRGWQAGVAEAESSIFQNPSWAICAFSSRIVQGTVKKWLLQSTAKHSFLVLHFNPPAVKSTFLHLMI